MHYTNSQRVIGHINTVAKIGNAGTIYTASNPYTPYYYSRNDLRFSDNRGFRLSMNDIVEFSIDQIGDRYYARNITSVNGKPLHSLTIYPKQLINYWSLSINSRANKQHIDNDTNEEDTRINASSVIHPTQRTVGSVISAMNEGGFGWILCNVANSMPIRYHETQIQSTGIKKLVLHSRVEFNVIKVCEVDITSLTHFINSKFFRKYRLIMSSFLCLHQRDEIMIGHFI